MFIFFIVVTVLTTLVSILLLVLLFSYFSSYREAKRDLEGTTEYRRKYHQQRVDESREDTLFSAKLYLLVLFWPIGLLYAVYHLFKKNGPAEKFYEDAKSLFTK